MKDKLKYLTKISLNKKIKTKWFYVANIIFLVLIVGLFNIDTIIKFFGGDFENITNILVIDNTENAYLEFYNYYNEYSKYVEDMSNTEVIMYEKEIDDAKKEVNEEDSILLIIDNDDNNFISAEIIVKSSVDPIISQIISSSLNSVKTNIALDYYNISDDMMMEINSPVNIEKISLDDSEGKDETTELVMGVVFPIVILPFFMLTMFLVQTIGAEINEEKSTRGMEIIISNVSPKVHFISKLLSSNMFVLIQGAILVLDVILAIIFRAITGSGSVNNMMSELDLSGIITVLNETGFIDNLVIIIPITLILMILTFIAYSLVAGILASMTTNMEDYQQLQTPIVFISLIGYYLAIMASMFEGAIFIKVFSYVPFISSLLAPALLVIGEITIVDVLISIGLLGITIYLLFKYGLRIYKVGILNYSSNGLWKKMFKAVRQK